MAELNVQNRTIFQGDNLDFLRGMNSECIERIATDPPFNKNRDFHATPDSLAAGARFQDRWRWDRDVHQDWIDSIQDDHPAVWEVVNAARRAYGDDMGAFLCFMAVRLLEMRRILKPTGSIYLHCDPTASHYLKALMDAIFGNGVNGKMGFRRELVWRRTHSKNFKQGTYGANHDLILYYTKGPMSKSVFNSDEAVRPYDEVPKGYQLDRGTGRYYAYNPIYADGHSNGDSGQPAVFRGVTYYPPEGRHWRVPGGRKLGETTSDGWARLDREGRMDIAKGGKLPRSIRYLDEQTGIALDDVWADISIPSKKESTGYPTQKPLKLYERIIKASSNPGDVVLDPFAGCATTPIAAERLGRQWIGIDIWEKAHEVVIKRLNDNRQLLRDPNPQVIGPLTSPPERTDTGEEAAPALRLMYIRPTEPWQKLTRPEMFQILVEAQAADSGVVCGGCGRVLPSRFMQLDHIVPRADDGSNNITNRILICGPCNLDKSDRFTLKGLIRENRKTGWMIDEALAVNAQKAARACADRIRFEWRIPEVEGIVQRVRAGVIQLRR